MLCHCKSIYRLNLLLKILVTSCFFLYVFSNHTILVLSFSPKKPVDEDIVVMATDIPVSRERELESGTPATPPKFDQTMQTAEVVEGSAARFDVTVTGSPVPKVRWLKDDKLLEENRKIRFDEDDNGVFSLFVNDVVVDDEGVYKCEATNVKGEVTCSAELIVEG